jgi:hypothetical protein
MGLKGSNSGASMHMVKKPGWESKERKKRRAQDEAWASLASEVTVTRLSPEEIEALLSKPESGSTFPPPESDE